MCVSIGEHVTLQFLVPANILAYGLQTVRVQVDDVPSANLTPYFDRVANKINEVASRGGRVLVHCMAGISRSSSLCIAYLMKYKGKWEGFTVNICIGNLQFCVAKL